MARYGPEHKARTRQAIVTAAAAGLRGAGIDGARVSDLMAAAGLTHGGFYAHFESKDELVGEACAAGVAAARDALADVAAQAPPEGRVQAMLDAYLTPERRDAAGCTLATLGGEIARQPAEVRERFTAALLDAVDRLADAMPAADAERRRDQVLAMVSSMVGAMMLSRAVADPAVSERLLRVGRDGVGGAVERVGGAAGAE